MALTTSFGGHTHLQTSPSTTWTISHNLGVIPIIEVYVDYNGALKKVLPDDIAYTTLNTCVISFTTAQTGQARLV